MALNVAQKNIVRVTLILGGLTAFEFLLAGIKGYMPDWFGWQQSTIDTLVLLTFIILTIFKAYYIVSEFMHLGHEIRRMILSILVPFIFIVWLIIGMIIEGDYYGRITKESYGFHQQDVPTLVVDAPREA
jgi:cytochrome c oxidase subunit 4